jgi:RNA polymerase sigma-70 factor (ECF subfamily)
MTMSQLSETEFEKLVYNNQSLINRVCDIYRQSQADKDDLFQEIIINIWKGLPSFKANSKLSTWIYRVSLNTAISAVRKKKYDNLVYYDKIPDSGISDHNKESEDDLRIRALYQGIDMLKPVEKAIILLYLEEKTYDEIAEIIGITQKNVSVKLVRIKKKLEQTVKSLITVNI